MTLPRSIANGLFLLVQYISFYHIMSSHFPNANPFPLYLPGQGLQEWISQSYTQRLESQQIKNLKLRNLHGITMPIREAQVHSPSITNQPLLKLSHELHAPSRVIEELETALHILDADLLCPSLS